MQEVLGAVVAKLAAAQTPLLITSLLKVLAQLVHTNAGALLDFLATQPAPGKGCRVPPSSGTHRKRQKQHDTCYLKVDGMVAWVRTCRQADLTKLASNPGRSETTFERQQSVLRVLRAV